jgi:hypothetical protein
MVSGMPPAFFILSSFSNIILQILASDGQSGFAGEEPFELHTDAVPLREHPIAIKQRTTKARR